MKKDKKETAEDIIKQWEKEGNRFPLGRLYSSSFGINMSLVEIKPLLYMFSKITELNSENRFEHRTIYVTYDTLICIKKAVDEAIEFHHERVLAE